MLSKHGIPFREDGPNCVKGNIVVHCPFCGPADPSEHMGIQLTSGLWGCWRNASHRGASAEKLVAALLKISRFQAHALVGKGQPELDNFLSRIGTALGAIEDEEERQPRLRLPKEFIRLASSVRYSARRFVRYLEGRGFGSDALDVADQYDLYYAIQGPYKDRIILPFTLDHELWSWTGRSIFPNAAIRYLSLGNEQSNGKNIKHALWNVDELREGGRTLVIVEGPFDALKLDFYGQRRGVRATCLFGVTATEQQLSLLREVSREFRQIKVMLDNDAVSQAMQLTSSLADLSPGRIRLPRGIKDPGELTKAQIFDLF